MIEVKKYQELSNIEVYQILHARNEVFIVEQACIYQDIDNNDIDAHHCFIKKDDEIIAYLRILNKGVSYESGPSIGRVLVTTPNRKLGYARSLMKHAIEFTFHQLKEDIIIISAQEYLISFYSSLGFIQEGNIYLEDNIPHVKMILKK